MAESLIGSMAMVAAGRNKKRVGVARLEGDWGKGGEVVEGKGVELIVYIKFLKKISEKKKKNNLKKMYTKIHV